MANHITRAGIDPEYANLDGFNYVLDSVLRQVYVKQDARKIDYSLQIYTGEEYMSTEEQREHHSVKFQKAISDQHLEGSELYLLVIAKELLGKVWSDVIYEDETSPKKLLAFNLEIKPIESDELEGGKGYLVTGEAIV